MTDDRSHFMGFVLNRDNLVPRVSHLPAPTRLKQRPLKTTLNTLHPNISMQIHHTVLHSFLYFCDLNVMLLGGIRC